MAEKTFRKIWCTDCWWSFEVPTGAVERDQVISCPDCGISAQISGHIVRGLIFCNDCYNFGCDASVCRCECHKGVLSER